ncbi:alkaline phosphatase family protein [Bradyrhizobium sp. CCBAU 21360]|uniref:alkaline phosphatase family protein n=1 Tax=Bradyrhizobium sp. CCBAU 21360 TaxID=1325081 RepID=UPI003FA48551
MRFVIVILDGRRPDQLDEAVTPNLAEPSKIGLRLARDISSFPSETRVSSAALATGGHSSAHGTGALATSSLSEGSGRNPARATEE